jgi:parallel beta-helix repeat protein
LTGSPSNQTVAAGDAAVFTAAAAGSAPIMYQWSRNGVAIAGATKASYFTPPTSLSDSGSTYSVAVSNSLGSAQSNPVVLTVTTAQTQTRFVDPKGSDSNAGTIDQPFRTIQHCATTISGGSTCEVRAGTYRETVTPNSNITITAYNFEPVVIDGSDPVSGWTVYRDSIYQAHVSLRADDTNQLFVGNEMMTEARWPNGDDLFHVIWSREHDGSDAAHIVDSNLPAIDWTGAKIHLWSGSDPFGHQTGRVLASSPHAITIDVGQAGTCPAICPIHGGYYYLYGTLNALDVEREWFYETGTSTLYFLAPGRADPNKLDVRAKQRQYAIDLRGKSGVTIRNLNIFAGTIAMDGASANNTIDRVSAAFVSHFTDLPVSATDPGGYNFSILQVHTKDSGFIIDGTGNTLQNSTIAYSAGAGVALEGTNNTIRNNLIHDVDYVGDYASGIDLDGDGNTIEHNTIYNIGRQAILVNATTNEDIGYNNLHNAMMLSRDGAEIYACCLQSAVGSRIHHNWIHDTKPVAGGLGEDYAMSGIGIDNGSGGFEVDQNVLWGNHRFSILINGAGIAGPIANSIHNNTIPDQSDKNRISLMAFPNCANIRVLDNRMVVKVESYGDSTLCAVSGNMSRASGAAEMSDSIEVGCNFEGCSSARPSAVLSDGTVTPCPPVAGNPGMLALIQVKGPRAHNNPHNPEQAPISTCYASVAPVGN